MKAFVFPPNEYNRSTEIDVIFALLKGGRIKIVDDQGHTYEGTCLGCSDNMAVSISCIDIDGSLLIKRFLSHSTGRLFSAYKCVGSMALYEISSLHLAVNALRLIKTFPLSLPILKKCLPGIFKSDVIIECGDAVNEDLKAIDTYLATYKE